MLKCQQDLHFHLHLKSKVRQFEDGNVKVLVREDRWFGRGVKETFTEVQNSYV